MKIILISMESDFSGFGVRSLDAYIRQEGFEAEAFF